MKFTLHNRTKKYILAVLILLFLFTGFQTYKVIKDEEVVTEETIIFEYSCQPSVDYKVILRPNELFSDTDLKQDSYYSKLLLDHIRADFNVAYHGSESTPISVKYQVLARVNGYQGQSTNKEIYWSKDFPLTEVKNIKTEGDSWELKEQVAFDLKAYDAFAIKAREISGMKVSSQLVVELVGTITAESGGEEIAIPFTTNLQAPLLEDVFKIEKDSEELLQAAVTESEEIIIPHNRTKASLLVVSMLLLLAAMAILKFIVKEPDELTTLLKKNKSLLKNYGSRMVAMEEIPELKSNQNFRVHSIKDMIKISDEVQKPIIYIPDENIVMRNSELFVIDENNIYRWNSA